MKKVNYLFTILTILFLTSCEFYYSDEAYKSVGEIKHITEKTTIKNFEHLEEPIVITMPVYENRYMDKRRKQKRTIKAGDIFVVIDLETDTVFDWVYFGGEHGLTYWRPIEIGRNPTRYYTSCYETGRIACLNPSSTKVKIIETDMPIAHVFSNSTKGDYFIKSSYNSWDARVFDSKQDKLLKPAITLEFGSSCSSEFGFSDENGDIWIVEGMDNINKVVRIDCKNVKKTGPYAVFNSYPEGKEGRDGEFSYYSVCYVNENYVFIDKSIVNQSLIFLDRKNNYAQKEIKLNFSEDEWLSSVVEVNGTLYMNTGNYGGEDNYAWRNFYKIDTENCKVELLNPKKSIAFDATENCWVRGSRIYFMCSRDHNNVGYSYYDTETKTFAPKSAATYIYFNDIVGK